MSSISTHVLDTALGKPAAGIAVRLERQDGRSWIAMGESVTDADGRCRGLADQAEMSHYRLTLEVGAYLARMGRSGIYPQISIVFVCDGAQHYHLPVLLSDNSYTTYRGS